MTTRRIALYALVALFSCTSAASAQYFGRNKVQYEKFDFQVLATEHFDIYYYPEEEEAVQLAARMAERWYARLSKVLRHELSSRQPLILYAAHPHFQQTHALPGEIGEGTGGVTEGLRRRIIMPFTGGLAETDRVLGHELVHAFQYDLASQRNAEGEPIGPALMALPLWFVEGMAEYLALGPVDANTAMWIREAISRDAMPTVRQLDNPDFFPYRYGHAFWAYVAGRWGDDAVGAMLRATGPQGDIRAAMARVLGIDEETFNRDWHEETRRTYAPFFETTRPASAFAKPLITADGTGGTLNVSPALSPDGRRVVFLSERSQFSIDMYLADAATGRVIRKLADTAANPHFDSLAFITSAGDWAPDSRRFVFAALSKGQPVLSIIDTETGNREEHEFPDLDEIYNPAFSPDGRRIAFSALRGGLIDLYVFSLESRALQQLTDDPFSDLDPEWTPDGRSIAWATDRFTSNLDTLAFGEHRIGLMDVPQGQGAGTNIRLLGGFPDVRNSNPEFSADGRWLYFIATPNGIPNIYRMAVSGGEPVAITNVLSGVSGITPQTPALSVASASDRLVFTVFENDNHNIYIADATPQAAVTISAERNGAALPPFNRRTGEVAQLLSTPTAGLPAPTQYPREPYRARLGLEAVGQPVVGVGADSFGTYAAGGLSLQWGDMLGYHMLGTTVQLTSRFQEIGGVFAYLNRKNRVNWGLIAEQTPYVTGAVRQGLTVIDGQQTFVQETLRITQMNTALSGVLHYPFSRVQRLEFSGGFQRIGFDRELETRFFSLNGTQIGEQVQELPRPQALQLGLASTALVYDSSLFGATSPILGQRYRLEYTQMGGDLLFSGLLADFRRYFMPARPFTIALRGLHFGRYGRDGEDPRLSPIYLGSPGLVRGYEINSFEASECVVTATSSCEAFDRLIGSRIIVAGAELRFPLLGVFSRRSFYGPLPVEVAFFGDAGTAWTSGDQPDAFGSNTRDWVRSVGAALRMNAFGYAILELDFVRPLDRPGRGWVWQFNLTPGF